MASVSRALDRIKQDLEPHLPPAAIEAACIAAGHDWRERTLGPVQTVHLFVLQILHFNAAIKALRRLAKMTFAASAYCEARARLPLTVLQSLLSSSAASLGDALAGPPAPDAAGASRWRGHRAYLVDGSATLVPDTSSLRKAFPLNKGQKKGCSLPVPHVLGLFDAMTGLVIQMLAFSLFVHERAKVAVLHPLMAAGDLLVGDRGFCSFAHLALLAGRGVLACFRMHHSMHVNFRPHRKHYDRRKNQQKNQAGRPRSKWVQRLGKGDQIVLWIKPTFIHGTRWMERKQFDALPEELKVREVRYTVSEKGRRTREVTVVTTLLDAGLYPKEAIAELYGIRWRVETHFAQLKTTLKMDRLKCQSEEGALKELAVFCLAYNLIHAVMIKAAARQGTTPDRISFVDALRWLLNAEPGEELVDLVINPVRTGRFHPRVIKRGRPSFPKMTRARHKYKPRFKPKMPIA